MLLKNGLKRAGLYCHKIINFINAVCKYVEIKEDIFCELSETANHLRWALRKNI